MPVEYLGLSGLLLRYQHKVTALGVDFAPSVTSVHVQLV